MTQTIDSASKARFPWLWMVVLVTLQAAIATVVLLGWMLCLAGGSIDRHTCGQACVEQLCRPGAQTGAVFAAMSALVWIGGIWLARRRAASRIPAPQHSP